MLFFLVKPNLFVFETNQPYFIYTNLTEIFISYLKLAIIISLYLYIPFIIRHFWEFFSGFDINIFQGPLGMHFEAKLNEYLTFLINMYFYSCFGSQICIGVILYILNISQHDLTYTRTLRRYVYVITFFIAALITPPDILSQVVVALFILFIYEMLIFLLLLKNEYVLTVWDSKTEIKRKKRGQTVKKEPS